MIEHFDKIWWEESYLLGWRRTGDSLELFVEVYLAEGHPDFEPYDKKKEFGCYKTARLVVSSPELASGLPCENQELAWNAALGEYTDVASVVSLQIDDAGKAIWLDASPHKGWSEWAIVARGASVDLLFELP